MKYWGRRGASHDWHSFAEDDEAAAAMAVDRAVLGQRQGAVQPHQLNFPDMHFGWVFRERPFKNETWVLCYFDTLLA